MNNNWERRNLRFVCWPNVARRKGWRCNSLHVPGCWVCNSTQMNLLKTVWIGSLNSSLQLKTDRFPDTHTSCICLAEEEKWYVSDNNNSFWLLFIGFRLIVPFHVSPSLNQLCTYVHCHHCTYFCFSLRYFNIFNSFIDRSSGIGRLYMSNRKPFFDTRSMCCWSDLKEKNNSRSLYILPQFMQAMFTCYKNRMHEVTAWYLSRLPRYFIFFSLYSSFNVFIQTYYTVLLINTTANLKTSLT